MKRASRLKSGPKSMIKTYASSPDGHRGRLYDTFENNKFESYETPIK